jgi:hypothetical protein
MAATTQEAAVALVVDLAERTNERMKDFQRLVSARDEEIAMLRVELSACPVGHAEVPRLRRKGLE